MDTSLLLGHFLQYHSQQIQQKYWQFLLLTRLPLQQRETNHQNTPMHHREGLEFNNKRRFKLNRKNCNLARNTCGVQHRVKGGAVRKRTIYNTDLKGIVCSIYRGDSEPCIAKKIFKSNLKESITDCFLKQLDGECKNLCSRKVPLLLQKVNPENFRAMKLTTIDLELQTSAPLFHITLSSLTLGNLTHTTVTAAVMLFSKHKMMSLLQHVIGQMLDHRQSRR